MAEFFYVIAKYRTIVVTMPEVGYANGALRNVHAFVPIFLGRDVRHSAKRSGRAPTKDHFDDCVQVWKTRGIRKCRGTVASDHGIYSSLGPALHFSSGKTIMASVHHNKVIAAVSAPAELRYAILL